MILPLWGAFPFSTDNTAAASCYEQAKSVLQMTNNLCAAVECAASQAHITQHMALIMADNN